MYHLSEPNAEPSSWTPKKLVVTAALVLVAALLLSGYLVWKKYMGDRAYNDAAQDAAKGTLPAISNNPLENRPNINPAEKTNPITEIKTNPFE